MRILFILAATAVVAGGLIATVKVPNVKGSERVLVSYRADPQWTLKRVEAAIFTCVPNSTQTPNGVRFIETVIAPLLIRTLELRMEGASKDIFNAEFQKWIATKHPELLTSLPDKDFLELAGYLQKIGDDEVENCVLSSTMSNDRTIETGPMKWALRL